MALELQYRRKFLKIFSITLAILLVLLFIVWFIFKLFFPTYKYDPSLQRDSTLVSEKEAKAEDDSISTSFLTAPVRTNVLIAGVDEEESLTDVIMVASFISTTGEINLISIPRDTYISFSGDDLKQLRQINSGAPSIMKLNAVHAYTSKGVGMDFLQKTVENLLGININYYIKMNLDAFKEIVDAVGGIYFEVQAGGLKYSDPTQGLYIDLKEGYQLLDGDAAEGLVRFRKGYATQDLKRTEVQQEFAKEFIKQVLQKETILSNLGEIVISLIKHVETDFSLSDISKYITCIDKIDTNNLNSITAPGVPSSINGASYYLLDTSFLKQIVDDYFYGNTDPNLIQEQESETIESLS